MHPDKLHRAYTVTLFYIIGTATRTSRLSHHQSPWGVSGLAGGFRVAAAGHQLVLAKTGCSAGRRPGRSCAVGAPSGAELGQDAY